MQSEPPDLTRLVERTSRGDGRAAEQLVQTLYDELRALARVRLRNQPPQVTLQPTALVHEVFMRLVNNGDPGWDGRGHFFGAAAKAMRNVLVDAERARGAQKRGGDREREEDALSRLAVPVTETFGCARVEEALRALEDRSPRAAKVVSMRFFAGLTIEECAQAMGWSTATVEREWRYARAWLHTRLGGEGDRGKS